MTDPDDGRPFLIPAILIVLTLAAMSPLLVADFTNWDDRNTITENPWLNPPALAYFAKFWDPRRPYMDIYIPLTYTVWSGLAFISYLPSVDPLTHTHLNSWVFHEANVIFHIISVLAVYAILKLLVKRPWPAALGAALYAVHPVQVEPVGWVSGLKDVMCGCMGLVAIWQYLVFAMEQQRNEATLPRHGFGPLRPYVFATIALVLALLSKPSGVVVPLLAGVIDLLLVRRRLRAVVLSLAPWVLIAIPFVLEARHAQPGKYLQYTTPMLLRPLVAGDALAFYLYKLVFPAWLTIVYGRTPQMVLLEHHWAYFTWIVPALVVVAILIWRKRAPWLWGALAVFWVAVLPVLGLVKFDFQDMSTVADHYLYVAMLGPAIALAFFMRNAGRRTLQICAVIIGVLAIRTWFQSRVWESSEALYRHAIVVNPYGCAAYNNLAYIYKDEHLYPQEIQTLQDGIKHVPDCAQLKIQLGMVLGNQGQLNDAEDLFHEVLRSTTVSGLKVLARQGLDEIAQARKTAATHPSSRQSTGSVTR